jgi:ABC-type antimicrobial peptide transport system permease subunit
MAFRNLRKYKTRNIISIIGLAVGFVCFAFSALWIRYEMSYDNFHPKADRIYRVQMAVSKWNTSGSSSSEVIQSDTPYPLANWLKLNYPEIEDACGIRVGDKTPEGFKFVYLDYSFCNIFDLNLPENLFFMSRTERSIAVIPEYNNEYAAKVIKEQFNWSVQTTIPRWPANTNIPFNAAVPVTIRYTEEQLNNWHLDIFNTYILVKNKVDVPALEGKLDKMDIPEWSTPISIVLTPLKQLRYKDPSGKIQSDVKFSHIRIFSTIGLLVILCSLFNHLTLYVARVRTRLRELTLRKVNGATNRQIASMLHTDYQLVILLSLVVGFMLMACILPTFKEYATIENNYIDIYIELLFFAALLIVCGFVVGGIPGLYFRKQTLNNGIKGVVSPVSRNLFRKGCLLVQLTVSLGMMFCAAVFIKQIHFLHSTDLGINHRNIASVQAGCCPLTPPYAEKIKQISGVIDAIPIDRNSFLRDMNRGSGVGTFVNKDGETVSYTAFLIVADARFFDFFGVEIIEGSIFTNEYDEKFILNETGMKEIGEVFMKNENFKGVARDFYLIPTVKAKPTYIMYPDPKYNIFRAIAYKYEEGFRGRTQQSIIEWLREEFPGEGEFEINFTYMEDVFEEHFKSERALLALLSVMTLACILIAVFGVYSLTNHTCQQRRKEIAIRKIAGAEVLDIIYIFFKENLLLLVLAALIAFPAGYVIMKRWLENYVKQTSMDAWLFVLIFLIVFLLILFSTISMVWKVANHNPSEEIMKGE